MRVTIECFMSADCWIQVSHCDIIPCTYNASPRMKGEQGFTESFAKIESICVGFQTDELLFGLLPS